MSLSKYNGQFVNIDSIHNYQDIYTFIKEGSKIFSNIRNYKLLINKLIAHERKRNYTSENQRNKIYAKQLLVMLPKNLSKSQKHETIKEFMLSISKKYKQILYIYRFEIIGKGSYCRIIVFERQVYKSKHVIEDTYLRNMYINKHTGRTTNSKDPDAILICKKGEVKRDKNGMPKMITIDISPKKYEYLKYRDNNNIEKKIKNFTNFKDSLTRKIVVALSKVLKKEINVLKLRFIPYGKQRKITNKMISYNTMISKINIEFIHLQKLFEYQYVFEDYDEARKDFNSLFYGTLKQINNKELTINKGLTLNIDPLSKKKNNYFYMNIQTFEDIVKGKIIDFYYKYFYDPMFDDYYFAIKHPFYRLKMNKTRKFKSV